MIDLMDFVIEKLSAIQGVVVQSAYDDSKPKYPMITVMQIDNYELSQYTTVDAVERVSAIPFQLDCYARNMKIDGTATLAANVVENLRQLADKIMQNECGMRRTASPPIIPHSTDNTVMRAISRYDSMIYLETGDIFKK